MSVLVRQVSLKGPTLITIPSEVAGFVATGLRCTRVGHSPGRGSAASNAPGFPPSQSAPSLGPGKP